MSDLTFDTKRELDEHLRAVRNFQSHLTSLGERLITVGGIEQAGRLFVLDRVVYRHNTEFMLAMGDATAPDVDEGERPAGKPRKPRAAGEHRHKFDASNVCVAEVDGKPCGKVKGAGGRGNKKPDAAERTQPLPLTAPERAIPSLAAAADRYAGGAHGSSGAERRR
jgi:hypothetical protein